MRKRPRIEDQVTRALLENTPPEEIPSEVRLWLNNLTVIKTPNDMTLNNVAAFARVIFKLGIRDRQRSEFWRAVGVFIKSDSKTEGKPSRHRPPFNAEYILYLLLGREDRDIVIGDLTETYGKIFQRFNKRRADIWFYKQVIGSLWPLFRRTMLRIGALVWLGRILRRLIS